MGPAEMLRATAIARQYFLEGRAKTEIAREFGLSRYKVARILDDCLEQGIVRIEIAVPTAVDGELSERLRRAFGLQHVLVIKTSSSDADTLRGELGAAAAALLSEIAAEDDVLGVSWGRTLHAMARSLTSLAPCGIVQMTGVTGTVSANSADLVRLLAAVSNGPAYPIYAPAVVSDATTARALLTQPGIAAAVSRFGSITKAAVAIGSWDAEGSQLYPLLEPETLAALPATDVAAEVCSIPLTEDGKPVDADLAQRTIGIGIDALRRIPEVIAVAGGESKARAIHTVLRTKLARSLVTDDRAARRILAMHTLR